MSHLEDFAGNCRTIFRSDAPFGDRLARMAKALSALVLDPQFVDSAFGPNAPAKRLLHRDGDTDIHILAHVFQPGVGGNPHSHAPSWAIYANAKGATHMREFARINSPGEDHAELQEIARYTMRPGDCRAYPASAIHAPHHDEVAWVVRVTGGDLDAMDRWRFRRGRDRIV